MMDNRSIERASDPEARRLGYPRSRARLNYTILVLAGMTTMLLLASIGGLIVGALPSGADDLPLGCSIGVEAINNLYSCETPSGDPADAIAQVPSELPATDVPTSPQPTDVSYPTLTATSLPSATSTPQATPTSFLAPTETAIALTQTAIAERYNARSVVSKVQPLGQLVSVSTQLAKADIEINIQSGLANGCGHSANHVAVGTIEAGVDLNQVSEDDVLIDEATDTLTITVPAPQLTSCRIDFIRQYDRSFTACDIQWDNARMLAQHMSLIDFRDDALERGVLEQASIEAEIALTSFLQLSTDQGVNVVISDVDLNEVVLPPSCQPTAPDGWEYDVATNAWGRLTS